MNKLKLALTVAILGFAGSSVMVSANAQSQPLLVSQNNESTMAKPRTGQSKEQVESEFGQPAERIAPVGEPPISRWHYSEFTVYFEDDKVIHAVRHRS